MNQELKLTLDGKPVKLIKVRARDGVKTGLKIIKILGGSILDLASGIGSDEKSQMKALSKAIDGILERASDDDLFNLFEEVICTGYVYYDNKVVTHLDDLSADENVDGIYLAIQILKEQLMFSYKGSLGKLLGNLNG